MLATRPLEHWLWSLMPAKPRRSQPPKHFAQVLLIVDFPAGTCTPIHTHGGRPTTAAPQLISPMEACDESKS